MWYSASSSYFQYPLLSRRASICSLQHFTLSSHHFYPSFCLSFHNVFARQFLPKLWPIQLAFLLFIVCRIFRRSQWPSGLRRGSTAACLLGLRIWIPPGAWMFVCCECCVLSARGLCDGPITRLEESYRLWLSDCVWSHERITLYV